MSPFISMWCVDRSPYRSTCPPRALSIVRRNMFLLAPTVCGALGVSLMWEEPILHLVMDSWARHRSKLQVEVVSGGHNVGEVKDWHKFCLGRGRLQSGHEHNPPLSQLAFL